MHDVERSERPTQLTEEELRLAAEGKSEQVFEKRAKPVQVSESDIKEAAAGRSQQVHEKHEKHEKR